MQVRAFGLNELKAHNMAMETGEGTSLAIGTCVHPFVCQQ